MGTIRGCHLLQMDISEALRPATVENFEADVCRSHINIIHGQFE
jgi:hypothetical protein